MRIAFTIVAFFCLFSLYSQIGNNSDLINNYSPDEASLEHDLTKLSNMRYTWEKPNRKLKRAFANICTKRVNYLKELSEQHLLMENDLLTELLQEVTNKLAVMNSLQPLDYKVYICRSSKINASNLGEGIILINLGLLTKLRSLEELAFVLAHEMAHDLAYHVRINTENSALLETDKDFQNQLKKASKKQYGSYTAYLELAYSKAQEISLHSRSNETVADSLAAQLCVNAGISAEYMISALSALKKADDFFMLDSLDIRSLFSSQHFEIPERVIDGSDYEESWSAADGLHEIPDSLRTHPHCDERIKAVSMLSLINRNTNDKFWEEKSLIWKGYFERITKEYLHTLIEENQYGLAGYYASCIRQKDINNTFINTLLYHCFMEYHIAIKERKFPDKVSFPDDDFMPHYNNWLSFLHNLNSKTCLSICESLYSTSLTEAESTEFITFSNLYKKNYLGRDQPNTQLTPSSFKHYYHNKKINEYKSTFNEKN